MSSDKNILLVEKYRPNGMEDYLFNDKRLKAFVLKILSRKELPNLLLFGPPGGGKSSLARVIVNDLQIDPADLLIVNASDQTSIDDMRDSIKTFVGAWCLGEFRVVVLEESDYISHNGQGMLRRLMEDYYENARFILTCNSVNRIVPAIRSRCQAFEIKKHSKDDIQKLLFSILEKEGIKYQIETIDQFIKLAYPDIRKMINLIQQHILYDGEGVKKTLKGPQEVEGEGDIKVTMMELLAEGAFAEIRSHVCDNVYTNEWEEVYRFLYDNIKDCPPFSTNTTAWENAIVVIAEHLYKNALCADQEINAAAMFIKLIKLRDGVGK